MSVSKDTKARATRETEQRDFQDYTFEEPDMLAIPEDVKQRFEAEGMSLRWIRVTLKGKDDIQNVGKRLQDGWVFVKPDEVPELTATSIVRDEGRYEGTVSRGDLALAKMPMARAQARQAFYENRSQEMLQAVNAQLQNHNDPRMPISNTSKSTVVKGRLPNFQS